MDESRSQPPASTALLSEANAQKKSGVRPVAENQADRVAMSRRGGTTVMINQQRDGDGERLFC